MTERRRFNKKPRKHNPNDLDRRDGETADEHGICLEAGTGTWVSQELIDVYHLGGLGYRKAKKLWILSLLHNSARHAQRNNQWFAERIGTTKDNAQTLISELVRDGWVRRYRKQGVRTLAIKWKTVWSWVKSIDDTKRERGLFVSFLIINSGLNGTSVLLWSYVDSFRFQGKQCFATNKTIALKIGRLHPMTASTTVSKLKKLELLKSRNDWKGRRILVAIPPEVGVDYGEGDE